MTLRLDSSAKCAHLSDAVVQIPRKSGVLTPELVAELEILALFNLDSSQEGLKIHQTAAPKAIAAAQRLFDKELITQPDGGYLTSLGRDAAQNVQTVLTILSVQEAA
jgi:uncharacterized protein (TIGR02647 family)